MIYSEKIYKKGIAAISILGGGGIIFSIFELWKYIRNQLAEDKFYGLFLIVIVFLFITIVMIVFLLFCVFVVKPIIITKTQWLHLDKMHKREVKNVNSRNKPVRDSANKVIKLSIDDMSIRNLRSVNNEDVKEFLKELNKK